MEVVFDFDGTIADTFEAVVKILNKLAPEYGFPQIDQEMVAKFKKIGSKRARKEFGVSWLQFIRIGRRATRELRSDIEQIRIFPGMVELFRELKKVGATMGVLSSNSKENILKFFKENNLENTFEYVVPCGLMWGKARKIKKIMKKRKLKPEEIVYVGDETKDIVACHKVGVKIIAVTWGYNSERALRSYHPDWLVNVPSEIVKIVDGIEP